MTENSSNALCAGQQSPIAIDLTKFSILDAPTLALTSNYINYAPPPFGGGSFNMPDIFTGAWHKEIDFDPSTAPYVTYNNKQYFLDHIHFHTPSEHVLVTLDGNMATDGEAHLFHKSADESMLVIAVWLKITDGIPSVSSSQLVNIVPTSNILPQYWIPNYDSPTGNLVFSYIGSKTTHPYDEDGNCPCPVQWLLMWDPLYIDQGTFDLIKPSAPNARAVQTNNNPVTLYLITGL